MADVTVCPLRADRAELAHRFVGRHRPSDDLDEVLKETLDGAEAMDASDLDDVCIDTSSLTVAEVVGRVRDSCRAWPGFSGPLPEPQGRSDAETRASAGNEAAEAAGNILLICGPTAVGKSTVGFELYVRYLRAGRPAGYIDLDQIGFVRPSAANDPGHHRLKARNLAAMWRTFHPVGARHLITTGPVPTEAARQAYIDALPAATVTVCRLHAGRAEMRIRIMSRASGGSWPQPGDPLCGQSAEHLSHVADQAAADAWALERAEVGDVRIGTDGRTVAEAAELIAAATGSQPDDPAGHGI